MSDERLPPADTVATVPADESPPLPGRVKVVVTAGPDQGRAVELDAGRHVIGKSSTCALVLADPKVSRQHLEVEVGPRGITLRDLQSRNGSFVQGARFDQITVGAAGTVTIGDTSLRFLSAEASAPQTSTRTELGRMRGGSEAMRRVYALVERIAPSDLTVLIQGETGTGKELCAEAIHALSPRAKRPFVIADMAGLPRSLMESELFGHVKGAFTGAVSDRRGAFEAASGGTLFIDEIGELELAAQPVLLRAIEQRQVKRVGATQYHTVDVRVIAATNRDLAEEVRAGRFRADLYHRLAVAQIELPPLRERKEDLSELVAAMLAGTGVSVSPATIALLAEYDWPGNVRELRNVIERALSVRGAARTIEPGMLGLEIADGAVAEPQTFFAARERLLASWERAYLEQLLKATDGNVSEAARRSGVARIHLYRLLKKYEIKKP
jgi:DNA-binding NtrC family response regulator